MFGQEHLGQDGWFEKEEEMSVEIAAEYLEHLAMSLRRKGECELKNDEGKTVVVPAEDVRMAIEYVKKGKGHELCFHLQWFDR